MRRTFVSYLESKIEQDPSILLITADLGYGMFDNIKTKYPDNFINCGASEQLMIGVAIGLYYEGFIPICYTITPFLIYRPFEMIRNYVNHENIPIKLVGTGRNKDYTYLGFTHWAEDDIEILSSFKNIIKYKPEILTKDLLNEFLYNDKPSYLNLSRN